MSDLEPLLTAHIVPPDRAADFLRAMDIEVEDLYAAVTAGERAAVALDHFAPPMAPGFVRWVELVAELRRRLAATGRWFPDNRRGQPASRHIASRRTLTVMSGDEATGSAGSAHGPRMVRRKGTATADSFRPDEVLFPLADLRPAARFDGALAGTWVLLYCDDGAAVRLEVSQPSGFDEEAGQFTGWTVRVLLDDWRPGDRRSPESGLESGLGAATDLQLFRSVAGAVPVSWTKPGRAPSDMRYAWSMPERILPLTSTMQDEHLSLATLLRHATTWYADAAEVATWTPEKTTRMSFGEMGREAARLANALNALGVVPGDRVGTFQWNNNEHMTAYVGIPAMGSVLHTINIRLFPDQITYIANHAADRVIITDGSLIPQLNAAIGGMTTIEHVIVVDGNKDEVEAPAGVQLHDYRDLLDAQPDEYDWPEIDERAAAAACYTSGTTGDPKGVMYSHRSIWLHSTAVCASYGLGMGPNDTVLPIVPMFHAMSWGTPFGALMSGASLILPDRYLQPEPMARLLAEEKPTISAAVPAVWIGIVNHLDAHPQDISHLRHIACGGSAVPLSLAKALDRHGVQIVQAWGMTETSPLASIAWPPRGVTGEDAWAYRNTQGRFFPGVQGRLVDDLGEVVPADGQTQGEVQVRGPWVTGSYYSPEGSEPVGPDKFEGGWLRTGDIGKLSADGYVTLVDRSKDVIKSGGEWISSVELENEVMAHPAVLEAVAIGVPDPKWDERPLVAVVLQPGAEVTIAELQEHLAGKFAKWQIPDNWAFIAEVPKTSVGKFDKKVLRAQHAAGDLSVVQE